MSDANKPFSSPPDSPPASPFSSFGKFVPGFDFLQNLVSQAASGTAQPLPQMPSLGSWVAPTLNVEELDKRITELKAVQFWLDQNAMALKATIQALEVQKMTLATLKGMNVSMADMANAFTLKTTAAPAPPAAPPAGHGSKTFAGLEVPPSSFGKPADTADASSTEGDKGVKAANDAAPSPASAAGVVDPLQWWGALTQQFQTIAANAMKDGAQKAAPDAVMHAASPAAASAAEGTAPAAQPNVMFGTSSSAAVDAASSMAKGAMKTASDMASSLVQGVSKSMADSAQHALNTTLRGATAWPMPGARKTTRTKAGTSANTGAPPARAAASPGARKPAAKKASSPAGTKTSAKPSAKPSAKTTAKTSIKPRPTAVAPAKGKAGTAGTSAAGRAGKTSKSPVGGKTTPRAAAKTTRKA